ncbi:MAG: glycosyltransferase, partial [Nostocaceae cyanobacterium]|nr:glycosyltransferase [Nostocaceae cyanobacterium]
MNSRPLVSILINNYNYERFLREAIDSASLQTYSPVEVVVVDDGSGDNSRELIASYGEQIVSVFKQNGGQASAFNAGFAASHGEIVCFLDADDYCAADK